MRLAERFAFLKEPGFVAVYEPDSAVHFMQRAYYADCVRRGIIDGNSQ